MKNIKLIIIGALSLLMVVNTYAQSEASMVSSTTERVQKTPDERAQKQTDRMIKKLELTDEQAVQIKAMQLEYQEAERIEREERKAKRLTHQANVRALLTAEQAKKYDKYIKKFEKKRKGKKGKKERKMKGKDALEKQDEK